MEINACHCSGPGSQLVPRFVQSAPAPELQIHLTPDDCSKQSPALRRRISAHVPEVQMPMFASPDAELCGLSWTQSVFKICMRQSYTWYVVDIVSHCATVMG